MYIDDSGAELTGTVDAAEPDTAAPVDLDLDRLDYTTIVETDDGSIAFTDTDADGEADLMTQLDADGSVVGRARFDDTSGEWVHVDVDPTEGGPITAGTRSGDVQLGIPTHDSDADGVDDTVVTSDSDGDILIYTDADEDRDADFATEITGDGRIAVAEHTDDGDWIVVERGHLDEHGQYHRDPVDDSSAAEESGWISSGRPDNAEVRIDPTSGHWKHD